MKIVVLHTDLRLYWPARLKALSEKLKNERHELTIIEIAGKGSPYEFAGEKASAPHNWQCLFPDKRIEELNPQLAKEAAINKLNEINPEVILSGAFAFSSGAAAIDWAKKNKKAVVIFDDSKKENVKRNIFVNTVKKIFYANTDAIFCPSEDWLDTYEYWGFKKESIFFGLDVVDNHFWQQNNDLTLPIVLPEKYFLCVGRQIKCKNFDVVIKAFHSGQKESDFHLVMVGEGEERNLLESLVTEEMKDKIHFLPFQSQEALIGIYQKAACFILPSLAETWGLVINEAMAAGLPIIVSNQCGCANTLVKESLNGFKFNPTNINELISIMNRFNHFSDLEIRQMKLKSREIISEWDLERFCKGAVAAIEYALQHKRRPFYFINKYLLKKWNGNYNPI